MPLKLQKDGKFWYVRGSLNGIRIRESTRTSKRDLAEARLRQIQRDIEDRTYNNKKTVAEAIAIYIEKGGEKRFLRPILEGFGMMALTELTPERVSSFALEKFSHMQPNSVRRQYYTPLNAVMNAAHEAQMCSLMRFKPPKLERKPLVYANAEWLRTFYQNAGPQIATLVLFISSTAARVSEACNLTLRDIDFDGGYVILRMTKNGKGRSIAVPQALLDRISQWVAYENDRRAQLKTAPKPAIALDEPVFCYSGRWSVNQAIERVCDRINAKYGALEVRRKIVKGKETITKTWLTEPMFPYMSSHKLGRHAFAARLLAEGKSLKFVAEAGGWKSINIVSEKYGHLERSAVDDRLRESTAAMISGMGSGLELPLHRLGSDKNLTNSDDDDILVDAAIKRIAVKRKDENGGRDRD